MTAEKPNNIGRMAVIQHDGQLYQATIMDLVAGTDRAKRVRIQRDLYKQGEVLMPGQYQFMEWADDD